MVSILHNAPPPASPRLRRRRLSSDPHRTSTAAYEPLPDGDGDEPLERTTAKGKGQFDRAGWAALSWSFGVSAVFTVNFPSRVDLAAKTDEAGAAQLLSLLVPVLYALPVFDIFGPLAHDWLWW